MIALYTIAFNRPDLAVQQRRLITKHLADEHELHIIDNAGRMHHDGLNRAAALALASDASHFGFLDHDVFPTRATTLVDKIDQAGFYGVGQRHPATGRLYLWPGFCFFSRRWLAGRPLDFGGIRDGDKRNDGDTGSSLWPLFQDEDWKNLFLPEHGYSVLRHPDEHGIQSWGYERIGAWIHLTNASGWLKVPDPTERDRLTLELLNSL